ncbi:MAG: hypothetical protein ACI89X_002389 [Planctomycetota bacterium]|jgi:hypothetical protein
MNQGSKKQNRYAAMFTKATPYGIAIAAPQMFLSTSSWLLLILLIPQSGGWPIPLSGSSVSVAISIVLGIALAVVFTVIRMKARHTALSTILALEKQLPWFGAEPVTVAQLPPRADLDSVLANHDYEAIHLDGTKITSWHDLATSMQEQIGPMPFPADDRQKVRALLTYLAGEKPQRRALIWHDAIVAANHNPALVASFAAVWSAYALNLPPGVLVFIDLPQHVEPHHPPAEGRHRSGPAPDHSNLKDAPDGSWWKPKPGELTN